MLNFFGRLHAMSAALIGQLLSACAGAYSAASSAVWWAASLPPTCRESLTHAALTSPHLQWRYSPVLHPRLRTTCACLGVAALGCPPRPALSPSGGRAGRFGRWTRSAVCPVQLEGLATRACSPHRGPKPARGVTVLAARGRGRGARLVASDEPHTYSADGPSPHGQHGRGCCGPSPCECACSPTERASLAPLHAARAGVGGQPAAAGDIDEWTPHPHRGRRIGEAAHPGPPSEGDPELRRQRALHALALYCHPGTRPAALRDHQADTAVAPVTPREATPGFTPPPSPDQLPRAANVQPLPWQDARPPSSLPGERNSWFYIPLLHAGAGNLTARAQHDWRSRPGLGPRFWELASLLRDAPPVMPSALAQTLLAVAECEAHDARRGHLRGGSSIGGSLLRHARRPVAAFGRTLALHGARWLPLSGNAGSVSRVLRGCVCGRGCTESGERCPARTPTARHAPTRRRRRGARRRSAARAVPTLASSECTDERVPACPPAAGDHDAAANATLAGVPDVAWLALDTVDLAEELRCPVPTLQDVPPFMRAAVRAALTTALQQLRDSAERVPALDEAPASRAWKLFLLAPRMLLARTHLHGARGRDELLARAAAFRRGEWAQLLVAARRSAPVRKQRADVAAEDVAERKREQACAKVRRGELSRARHILTAAELAPGNEATWRLLADLARRPPQPRTPVPSEVADYQPSSPLQLGPTAIAAALRDAKRGGAAGLTGMRAEHLKVRLRRYPAGKHTGPGKHRSRTGFSSANCSQQARWWRAWHSDGRRVPPPGVACFGEGLGNNFRQSHAPLPICFASTSGHGCTGGPCPCGPGPCRTRTRCSYRWMGAALTTASHAPRF